MQIEFHWQEGFYQQPVSMAAGGKVVAEFDATTRLQTGLANIVTLDLQNGEEVMLTVGGDPAGAATVTVDAARPYVTVNWVDGELRFDMVDRQPGYL